MPGRHRRSGRHAHGGVPPAARVRHGLREGVDALDSAASQAATAQGVEASKALRDAALNALGGCLYGVALASLFVLLMGVENTRLATAVVFLVGMCALTWPRRTRP